MSSPQLTNAITALLDEWAPHVLCFTCLAKKVNAPQKIVQEAVQPLLLSRKWGLTKRMCASCESRGVFLERRPDPPAGLP